jgi:hypothetical protein
MDIIKILTLTSFFWIFLIAAVSSVAFFRARGKSKIEICSELSCVPRKKFFSEFEWFGRMLSKIALKTVPAGAKCVKVTGSAFFCVAKTPRSYFSKFTEYVNGRREVEQNGVNGYWHELNEAKGNGNGDSHEKETAGGE